MSQDLEARLSALLAPPDEFPDEIFTARMRRAVLAEERLRAARRGSWRRFAVELAGSLAVLAAYLLIASGQPPGDDLITFEPATAGLLLVGFWTFVAMRSPSEV
ncbi:MAG TPA: hypothetical protein VF631_10185 [Allosphingosinicella sp.]|jgi:hypothetical protein|uniref:hypothetical protein n=1 Tax=Allosphingosinicella sp. TaxID=2823234 RepID=UPI002F298DC0